MRLLFCLLTFVLKISNHIQAWKIGGTSQITSFISRKFHPDQTLRHAYLMSEVCLYLGPSTFNSGKSHYILNLCCDLRIRFITGFVLVICRCRIYSTLKNNQCVFPVSPASAPPRGQLDWACLLPAKGRSRLPWFSWSLLAASFCESMNSSSVCKEERVCPFS